MEKWLRGRVPSGAGAANQCRLEAVAAVGIATNPPEVEVAVVDPEVAPILFTVVAEGVAVGTSTAEEEDHHQDSKSATTEVKRNIIMKITIHVLTVNER